MQWSDIPFAPSSRTLRQFAGLWVVFFGGLAAWNGWVRDHHTLALVFLAVAVAVGPLGLVWPQAIRWVYMGWLVLVFPIGWLVSQVILAGLFYGVITPIGLVFKLMGRDVLCRRPCADRDTYWTPKPAAPDAGSYFRQF